MAFKMTRIASLMAVAVHLVCGWAGGDTFTDLGGGSGVFHGYPVRRTESGRMVVQTVEKGEITLDPAEYRITPNGTGRNGTVAVMDISDVIEYELETSAFADALAVEAAKGPDFILIEIDTPGGRIGLAMEICDAIAKTWNCQTVAFVKGGGFGGAYSAGAAVTLACDKIYMAKETAIGAATVVARTASGRMADIKEVAGETIGEKSSSVWRNYLASLAQSNDRPGILARAMASMDVEVVEVSGRGGRSFIDPASRMSGQNVVRVWNRKGSLLTLPAQEAVQCGIADMAVNSRRDVFTDMGSGSARAVINDATEKARAEIDRVTNRYKQLSLSIGQRIEQLNTTAERRISLPKAKLLSLFRDIIKDISYLIRMKEAYPDVPYDQDDLESVLSSVKADYETIKSMR